MPRHTPSDAKWCQDMPRSRVFVVSCHLAHYYHSCSLGTPSWPIGTLDCQTVASFLEPPRTHTICRMASHHAWMHVHYLTNPLRCLCALLPMLFIIHVFNPQGIPFVSPVLINILFTYAIHCTYALLPMCRIAHVSKICQIVKKMSNFQKYVNFPKICKMSKS